MAAETNYWLIWLIYLAAGGAFYGIFWWLTRFKRFKWISYSLRAVMLALILTPWFTTDEGRTMAPALMVMTLDAITIGREASGRAASPLLLAVVVAELIATLLYLVIGRRKPGKIQTDRAEE